MEFVGVEKMTYEHVSNGTIFITTGKNSTAPINTLKKNNMTVYPVYAKQYISGKWRDMEAKTYQNGEWIDWWNHQLYYYGKDFELITGGWTGCDRSLVKDNVAIDFLENGMKMYLTQSNSRRYGILRTVNPVDLTNFNTVTFTGYIYKGVATTSGKEAYGSIKVFEDFSYGVLTEVASTSISNGGSPTTVTVDVSALTGLHHIGAQMYSFDSTTTYPHLVMNSLTLS